VEAVRLPSGDTVVLAGDTTMPWRAYAAGGAGFAEGRRWLVGRGGVLLPLEIEREGAEGRRWNRSFPIGRPLDLGGPAFEAVTALRVVGEHDGVPVYAEPGGLPVVLYVLVRPGCVFQPYETHPEEDPVLLPPGVTPPPA
jgi:hypothetical protein